MDFVEPIFRKMYTLEIGYQRTQYKRGEIFPRNFFMDITIEDFQAGRSYFKLRVVIEENIITIRKRIKGRFLTNSPVIATAANSFRPVGAHLKCMISILQACIQNCPTFTIRSNAIIQLQQEVY